MLYFFCLTVVVIVLVYEYRHIVRARKAIPLRIHVHGTRGKTSCVRLIAKELREAGLRVLAKTTGDAPEIIYPDATVKPFPRRGPARITEHIKMLLLAEELGVDALVLEGMALQPETVAFSERMIQATHFVVVNVRADHAETMGSGFEGVTETLAEALPKKGTLYVSDEKTERLLEIATSCGIPIRVVSCNPLTESQEIAYALTDDILSSLGKARRKREIEKLQIIPVRFSFFSTTFLFFDFFSANDVTSAELLFKESSTQMENTLRVALLSTRSDRPLRTFDFLKSLSKNSSFEIICFAGSHTGFARLFVFFSSSLRKKSLFYESSPEKLLPKLINLAKQEGYETISFTALGNAHGAGELWREYISNLRSANHAH